MSAMLVAPAAAARQWTHRLGRMTALAAFFGATAGVTGAVLSATTPRLPTGPAIVLCAAALVIVSLLLAPERGLVAAWWAARRRRGRLREIGLLEDLYTLSFQHPGDPHHPHPRATLEAMTARPEAVAAGLDALAARGWAARAEGEAGDGWALTPAGLRAAEALARSQTPEEEGRSAEVGK
jgi:manganese/zinc/iron transport system permease protein